MLVDLVQVTTRDGVRLDGAYQAAAGASPGAIDAAVCVHGTGSNFYGSTLFDALAEQLLSLGVAVLRVNTRGHDLVSTAATPRGGRRQGAAYEVLDDCRHDLAAWAAWLRERVGPRIGLIGHSSGAVKCLYAQAHDPDVRATRVVALSPPRLSHALFAASDKGAEFRETYDRATSLVAAGEPEALLDVRVPLPFVITAAGFAEKYGRDERYDYLRFLDHVGCPVLVTLGEVEMAGHMAFRGASEAIRGAAPPVAVEVVAGADHFYTGRREELAHLLVGWLSRSPASD
jgi:dienelactone hydrolase